MASQDLPVLGRKVTAESSTTPEFQSSVDAFAASRNNLSAIGAQVAQSASNAMATQLGYESGKTPQGDLMPPITNFDKTFTDSYHAQANATLSLQGQKLLDDAHVEMSKPSRLTPELIANTHAQLQMGLDKIAEQAPTAIKGSLEHTFDSQLLQQTTQYKQKMISEQREDQKNTVQNGIDVAIKNALEFGKNGDVKGAQNAVASAKAMADSALASNFLTPEEARVAKETAEQTGLNGVFINQAMGALKEGKYPEFEKNYSENKPKGMTNEQWLATGHAFNEQIGFIQSLRTQDENLKAQQMMNSIAADPGSITGTQWAAFTNSVSGIKAEEVKFKYIQALKKNQSSTVGTDALIENFSSPEAFANSSEKTQNAAFNKQVNYAVQQSEKTATPLSHEEAEVQVAASAGGKVPVFVNGLKNKLSSANPAMIESAAIQIHTLQASGAGHALAGLSDQDKAAYTKYEALRDSRDPATAARDMTEAVYNQDPDVQQMNKHKWSNLLTSSTQGGTQLDDFALQSVGLNKSDFITSSMGQVYGTNILQKYGTYFELLNGDKESALKLTKQYVDENYGDTGVNGGSHKTLHPLEMVLGFSDKKAVPYIQQDVVNQLNEHLAPIKESYANKKVNEYWETLPVSGKDKGFIHTDYDPVKVKRHMRTANGEKTDTFNVVLQGNAFDNWDVSVQTASGMRNLFQIAPYLGVISYKPNVKAIRESYSKDHSLK